MSSTVASKKRRIGTALVRTVTPQVSSSSAADEAKDSDKQLTSKINKLIKAAVETKHAYHSQVTTAFNSGITSAGDLMFPLPNVPQDVTEAGRVGDQIKGHSLKIQGIITMNLSYAGSAENVRIGVRVMVVQPKLYTNRDVINTEWSAWTSNLLRKGGTNSAFTGTPADLFAEINSDLITTYYNKVYTLSMDNLVTAVGAQGVAYSTKFFTANLKLRNKLMKYNSGYYGNLAPSNYCPVLLIGYCHLDGATPDSVQTQLNMSYISNLAYEDA